MPRLLDLFCCEGGASMGYYRAGFDVYGVDLFRHRDDSGRLRGYRRQRYPFPAYKGDVIETLEALLRGFYLDFTDRDGSVSTPGVFRHPQKTHPDSMRFAA